MKTDAFFMYFVYILYSEKCDRYYIGYCEDLEARLNRHNRGMVTATKNCKLYFIKASKTFQTEIEARREELRLKNAKSRKYLEWLIQENW
jgi:putative endonuclease